MSPVNPLTHFSRRHLLTQGTAGVGLLGLADILAQDSASPLDPHAPHSAPRAKRIIHLLMNGGPSHIDTFDPKPLLAKYEGQRPSTVDLNTQRKTTGILKSPYRFAQHGQSGLWVSELFPHVARHADKLCLIHSMHTDIPEHISGLLMMNMSEPTNPHGPVSDRGSVMGLAPRTRTFPPLS